MKDKIKLILLFLIISSCASAEFEKLDKIELKLFGYQVSTDKSLDDRVAAIEKIISGGVSEGNINSRVEKINDFISKDGIYLSPATKIGKIEFFLFKKREDKSSLLERVEKIEFFLFKKIENKLPITSRIVGIYSYLFETREEITLSGDLFNIKTKIVLKPFDKIYSATEGEEVYFELATDIKGIAKSGSKIRGKILRKESKENRETYKVMLYEMINEELREINIYKKIEIIVKDKKVETGYEIDEIGIIG